MQLLGDVVHKLYKQQLDEVQRAVCTDERSLSMAQIELEPLGFSGRPKRWMGQQEKAHRVPDRQAPTRGNRSTPEGLLTNLLK